MTEIRRRYDSEWVLLENPATDDSMAIRSGTILVHSKDRDEVYRRAVELRPKLFATLCFGNLPKGAAIVL